MKSYDLNQVSQKLGVEIAIHKLEYKDETA